MTTYPYAYRVTSTTSPTLAVENAADEVEVEYLLRNTHATVSVFFGDVDVTTSIGYEVRAGEAISVSMGFHPGKIQKMYVISASAVVVDVLARLAD